MLSLNFSMSKIQRRSVESILLQQIHKQTEFIACIEYSIVSRRFFFIKIYLIKNDEIWMEIYLMNRMSKKVRSKIELLLHKFHSHYGAQQLYLAMNYCIFFQCSYFISHSKVTFENIQKHIIRYYICFFSIHERNFNESGLESQNKQCICLQLEMKIISDYRLNHKHIYCNLAETMVYPNRSSRDQEICHVFWNALIT